MPEVSVFIDDQKRRIKYVVEKGKVVVTEDVEVPNHKTCQHWVEYAKELDQIQPGLYQALLTYLKKKRVEHLKNGSHDRGYEP